MYAIVAKIGPSVPQAKLLRKLLPCLSPKIDETGEQIMSFACP